MQRVQGLNISVSENIQYTTVLMQSYNKLLENTQYMM